MKYNITQWDTYKLNYWAIPKCGNTAVKACLALPTVDKHDIHSKEKWVHDETKLNYINDKQALANDYANFTVTRNPYERFISMYKDFGIRRPYGALKRIIDFEREMTFDYFLSLVLEHMSTDKCNKHIRSQTSFICKKGNVLVEEIIDLKNLQSFFDRYNITLRQYNKTSDDVINLTQEQKNKIYNRYESDFELLGYKK